MPRRAIERGIGIGEAAAAAAATRLCGGCVKAIDTLREERIDSTGARANIHTHTHTRATVYTRETHTHKHHI